MNATLNYLYRTSTAAALGDQSDADLLRQFVSGTGVAETAFAVLVRRYGPTVLRVCHAKLRHGADAEDAFQATFLILAKKARTLRLRGPLGPWLHEVARRVSTNARAALARRRRHERRRAVPEAYEHRSPEPDLPTVVHDALARLPQRFRLPVVLCDLQGLSYDAAAAQLRWTHAAVRSRLARGRQRLRASLGRAGLAPVAGAVALGVAPTVPRSLAATTARLAAQVAAGTAARGISDSVLNLMHGGLQMMLLAKLKTFGFAALATAVLIAGAIGLSAQDSTQRPVRGADGPTTLSPPAGTRSEPIRDADRIVRLAIEAERQQDGGDVAGARRTVAKIADAARAWQNRLSPPNEKNPTNPANSAERSEHWRKQVAARILDHDFAEAHLVELLKHVGECQTCHTGPQHQDRSATLLEQIRVKDKELAALREQLGAIRGPKPATISSDFRGTIKAVQGDLATITPGSDAGAAVGGVLQIYRLNPRPEYLGTIVIRAVTPHEAVGQLQGPKKAQIQPGDEVAARLQ
jgi:RNA polymerase sigma factor (sigma-70 family)